MATNGIPPVIIEFLGDDGNLLDTIARDKAALAAFARNAAKVKLNVDTTALPTELAVAQNEVKRFIEDLSSGVTSDVSGWQQAGENSADAFATSFYSYSLSDVNWRLTQDFIRDSFGNPLALSMGADGQDSAKSYADGFYSYVTSDVNWRMLQGFVQDRFGNPVAIEMQSEGTKAAQAFANALFEHLGNQQASSSGGSFISRMIKGLFAGVTGSSIAQSLTAAFDEAGGGNAITNFIANFFNSGQGGGKGIAGFLGGLFHGHITGGWLAALGVPANIAQVLGPTIPILTSVGAGLASLALGFTALGVAAAPAAIDIFQGVSAIDAAQTAVNNSIPGTQNWQSAVRTLGNTWSGIPPQVQSAVSKIISIFGKGSAIGNQAGAWLTNLISNFGGAGNLSKDFMPLVVAMENAIDSALSKIGAALGGGGLAKAVKAVARMVGPMMAALVNIAGSIFQIGKGLATIGAGGEGVQVVVQAFQLLATLVGGAFFVGIISGFVMFDRTILKVAGAVLGLLNIVFKLINMIPGVGIVLKFASGGLLALSAAAWLATSGLKAMIVKIYEQIAGWAASAVEMLFYLGVYVSTMVGISLASEAANVILGATVIGGIILLGVAVYELATHWGRAWADIKQWLSDAYNFIKRYANDIVIALGALVAPLKLAQAAVGLLKGAWDSLFGGGSKSVSSSTSAVRAWGAAGAKAGSEAAKGGSAAAKAAQAYNAENTKLYKNIMNMGSATAKAQAAAQQYNQALQGVYPTTGKVTAATAGLISAEEQIGPSIASQATGFGTFTQGATQSFSQLMNNIKSQNVTLGQEMQAAQKLIAMGMSPKAVELLSKTAPQDLVMMSQQSVSSVKSMSNQVNDYLTSMAVIGGKNGFALTNNIVAGLNSGNPATRQWAQNEAQILNINTTTIGQNIGQGLINGMNGVSGQVFVAAGNLASGIVNVIGNTLHISSPSRVMMEVGGFIGSGLAIGITNSSSAPNSAIANVAGNLVSFLHTGALPMFRSAGTKMMTELAGGIASGSGGVVGALNNSVSPVGALGLSGRNAGGATIQVNATFQIMAPGGDAAAIQGVIQQDAAQAFAEQVLASLRSGAGRVY